MLEYKNGKTLLVAAPSTLPENVDTPDTLKLSKLVCPSTSISALISKFPSNTVEDANVVTPAILTLSKFVCPSTSKSAFRVTLPEKVQGLTILPVKSPTKDVADIIPDAFIFPAELIPTPF